jgi:hypothetical protein
MFDGVNAISVDGWGSLLKAFLPTSWGLVITDVMFFLEFPAMVLFGLVLFFKKHVKQDSKGAWRACGAAWAKCFWLAMIAMVVAYFGAKDVLTTSISGTVSFEEEYRASLPGYTKTAKSSDYEKAIAERIRNQSAPIKSKDIRQRPEFKVVRFFCRNYGYIHPFFFTIIDMLLLGWFFWPGFKMKKQGIKL